MDRAKAIAALDKAFYDRLKVEYDHLADGFMGSPNARLAAQITFDRGCDIHIDALAYAVESIAKKIKE
jgi:hypothetical protein